MSIGHSVILHTITCTRVRTCPCATYGLLQKYQLRILWTMSLHSSIRVCTRYLVYQLFPPQTSHAQFFFIVQCSHKFVNHHIMHEICNNVLYNKSPIVLQLKNLGFGTGTTCRFICKKLLSLLLYSPAIKL